MKSEFYKNIGSLFYAIAKADGNLTFEEYTELSRCLERDWFHVGDKNLEVIKKQFNDLQSENKSADICFKSFVGYLNNNSDLFEKNIRSKILKTANDIAYAFSKINKAELTYVAKLNLEFKKI